MTICFIAPGPMEWASTRWRCLWPGRYLGATVMDWGNYVKEKPKAEAYIWCKIANLDEMKAQRKAGATVVWDLCDPVHWWSPAMARNVFDTVNYIVASNENLAADCTQFSDRSVKTIPDRVELEHYKLQRKHVHPRAEPVRFIWYGAGQNRFTLLGAIATLERLHADGISLELTIFDDHPNDQFTYTDSFPVYHTKWTTQTENQVIAAHDVAILPPYPGAWGKVKSNNKHLTAWACGIPVSDGEHYDTLQKLASFSTMRVEEAKAGRAMVLDRYDVRQSAAQWTELLR